MNWLTPTNLFDFAKMVLAAIAAIGIACTSGCIGFNRTPFYVGMPDDRLDANVQREYWVGMTSEGATLNVTRLRTLSDIAPGFWHYATEDSWVILSLAPGGITMYALGYAQSDWIRIEMENGVVVRAGRGRKSPGDDKDPVWRPIQLLTRDELHKQLHNPNQRSDFNTQ